MSVPSSSASLHLDEQKPAPDTGSASFQSENPRAVRNAGLRDAPSTYVGKSMIIKGEVSGAEPVNVESKIGGSISVPGAHINIGREAVVKSNVQCGEVIIRGTLCGNLTASDRVEVHSGGSLIGEVVAGASASRMAPISKGGSTCGDLIPRPTWIPTANPPRLNTAVGNLECQHLPDRHGDTDTITLHCEAYS